MSAAVLHLPLDFERREYVRRFARQHSEAVVTVLRMWIDWATAGTDFRPLKARFDSAESYDWSGDDLTFVLEEYCGHDGAPGDLIKRALLAGVMKVEFRGENYGLVLAEFWRFNEHLSPNHRTIQQRGAAAMHSKARDKRLVQDQARIIAAQEQLIFDEREVTADETRTAVAIIMRLDRALGLPLRTTTEYVSSRSLLEAAVRVVRTFKSDEIDAVCQYVIENRDNPRLVKMTERLLEKFGELLGKALEHAGA
jgi:hypothetical protein